MSLTVKKTDRRFKAHDLGFTHFIEIGSADSDLMPLNELLERINEGGLIGVDYCGEYEDVFDQQRIVYSWKVSEDEMWYRYYFRNDEDLQMVLLCL